MSKKLCGIYCIENIVNNKKYIGQSRDIYQRWSEHVSVLNRNKHHNSILQNAWNKYGQNNFHFYIIELCEFNMLDEKEIFYIDKYNTFSYQENSSGYNLTTGGFGPGVITEEKIQALRNAQKSRPIYQIDMGGNIVKLWEHGAREAAKTLNIHQPSIWECLNLRRRTYKNYIWVYVDDYDNFDLYKYKNQNTQSRRIKQYDFYGNLITIWNSANSAKIIGADCSCIIKNCKRKRKYYKNSIWCYEDDDFVTPEYISELHNKLNIV